MMVRAVPVCSSEVTHGVRGVSQTRMNARVGLLGISGARRHLLLLPSLQAGCFGVQVPLCGFNETQKESWTKNSLSVVQSIRCQHAPSGAHQVQ